MNIIISTEVLKEKGLTLSDFGVLLYYLGHGLGDISPEQTEKLWNMNLLTKVIDGYAFNPFKRKSLEEWFVESNVNKSGKNRFVDLANKLRDIYPEGSKAGKNGMRYSWRDNTMTIARKLKTLDDKCREVGMMLDDDEVIEATRRYVESFKDDYTYMQLLKYFILKKDPISGEEKSQLLCNIQDKSLVNHESQEQTLFSGTNAFGEML